MAKSKSVKNAPQDLSGVVEAKVGRSEDAAQAAEAAARDAEQVDLNKAAEQGIHPEPEVIAPTAKVPVITVVKKGLALRGGRGEWYKLLCQFDGKPVSEFIAKGKEAPASHYTARSTKCGQPKTPESRLSWFKRVGIVTLS